MRLYSLLALLPCCLALGLVACADDDDDGTEAQRRGVGAACAKDADCEEEGQTCLPFKGGYCGIASCTNDGECPLGSACVSHDDGANYCFLTCANKPDCNHYRPLDVEANCSSSIEFTDSRNSNVKACVPPSG